MASKMEDLKTKSNDELRDRIGALKKELFNLRFQFATGESSNTSRSKIIRKEIARAMTQRNQNKAAAQPAKQTQKKAGA